MNKKIPLFKKDRYFRPYFLGHAERGLVWERAKRLDGVELLCCPLVAVEGLSVSGTDTVLKTQGPKQKTNAAATPERSSDGEDVKQQATRRRVAKDRQIPYKSSPCLRPPIQHRGPVLCCRCYCGGGGGGGAHPNQATTQSSRHP